MEHRPVVKCSGKIRTRARRKFEARDLRMAPDTSLTATTLPTRLQAGLVPLKSQLQAEQAALQLVSSATEQAARAAPAEGIGQNVDISA